MGIDLILAKKYTEAQAVKFNGSPKGVYATLSALQTAFPTGTIGIYLVVADGNWYYWYNNSWTAGGIYQSTGIADGTIKAENVVANTFERFKKTGNIYRNSFNPQTADVLKNGSGAGDGVNTIQKANSLFVKYSPNTSVKLVRQNATKTDDTFFVTEGSEYVPIAKYGIKPGDTVSFGCILKTADINTRLYLRQYSADMTSITGAYTPKAIANEVNLISNSLVINENTTHIKLNPVSSTSLETIVEIEFIHWYVVKGLSEDIIYVSDQELNYMQNIITNSNFDGVTGWKVFGGVLSTLNSVGILEADGTNLLSYIKQVTSVSCKTGHIIFGKAKVIVKSSDCKILKLILIGSSGQTLLNIIVNPLIDNEYILYGSFSLTSAYTGNLSLRVDAEYETTATALGKIIEIQDIALIDKTEQFGAGKELLDVEILEMLAEYHSADITRDSYVDYEIKDLKSRISNIATIDVTTYGAKGDGITNDTVAIRLAVSNLPNGGTLFFPIGTYLVDNIMLKSNIIVKGNGESTIIKLNDNAVRSDGRSNCFTVENITNVIIKDIQLDGNRVNNAATGPSQDDNFNGILVLNSSDVRIENIWSHSNGYHGCIMVGATRIIITHSKFTDNGYRPFHGHAGVHDCEFSFNYCSDNGKGFTDEVGNPYDGIYFFDDANNLIINGNRIITSNNVGCIVVGGTVTGTMGSQNIVITNNVCESKTSQANGIVLSGNLLNYITIGNNVLHNCQNGIIVNSDNGNAVGLGITINNNIIENNLSHGINLYRGISNSIISGNIIRQNGGDGIYARYLYDCVISNNILSDNGAVVPTNYGINLISCLRINVTSNNFVNTSPTERQKYGVREDSVSDSNLIMNNQFYQMATEAYLLQGVKSIAKNNMVNGVFVI